MTVPHSSSRVVDGARVIRPRASLPKSKDLRYVAWQKYEDATTNLRNSSRGVAEGPMGILL